MFLNVKTYEVTDDSTGSKQTFSFPGSCEISFNALMANHGLENVIVARDLGCIGKKSDKISIIKNKLIRVCQLPRIHFLPGQEIYLVTM